MSTGDGAGASKKPRVGEGGEGGEAELSVKKMVSSAG